MRRWLAWSIIILPAAGLLSAGIAAAKPPQNVAAANQAAREAAADRYRQVLDVRYLLSAPSGNTRASREQTLSTTATALARQRLDEIDQQEEAAVARYAAAERRTRYGRLGDAYGLFRGLAADDLPASFREQYGQRIAAHLREMEAFAGGLLLHMESGLRDSDRPQVSLALALFRKRFGSFSECPRLHAAFEKLCAEPRMQRIIREDAAAARFGAAERLLSYHYYDHAILELRALARDYPDTPAGQDAAERAKGLADDTENRRHHYAEAARLHSEWQLCRARGYERVGALARAATTYRRVIHDYPDTAGADFAAEELRLLTERLAEAEADTDAQQARAAAKAGTAP